MSTAPVNPHEVFGGGVAVITGAGAGIGAGLARHAHHLGMSVVLADVDHDAIAALRNEIIADGGSAVDAVCDVRDPDAVTALAEQTYRDLGPVRLLVNNAGVEQFGYLWDTPVANWNRVMDINVSGVFHGVRAFVPRMIAAGSAAWIWNLSSIGGVATVPLQTPYIVSKHAVLALTECLRLEIQLAGHADLIQVQAVLPGAVKSNIFEAAGGVGADLVGADVDAADSQRDAMLAIKAGAMDPLDAAEVLFEESARGAFYLLTQPEYVRSAMAERAEALRTLVPPQLRDKRRFDPAKH